MRGSCGRDRMVVGFPTTYALSVYQQNIEYKKDYYNYGQSVDVDKNKSLY
jgi:hypothetical protein